MYKNLFFIIVSFLLSVTSYGQIENRKYIKGKVNVPAEDDPENISVYNKNSNKGTVTDKIGKFKIFAAVNDTLTISSIQYSDFDVIVDKEVFNNKTMTIYLRESISILDEVVVRPYDLSGNLEEDAQNIETLTIQPITQSSKSIVYGYTGGQEYAADRQTSPGKAIAEQSYFRYGLNFVNLFKVLVNNKDNKSFNTRDKKEMKEDPSLNDIYSNQFFKTYLNIPRASIDEFISYAKENGLKDDLMKKGNEMELIQFLVDKSRAFREREF